MTRAGVLQYAGARADVSTGPADWRFRTAVTALLVVGLGLFGGGLVALLAHAA